MSAKSRVPLSPALDPHVRGRFIAQPQASPCASRWFDPVKVIEITGADLTISPVHRVAHNKVKTGGMIYIKAPLG
jgi:hypothetical protein